MNGTRMTEEATTAALPLPVGDLIEDGFVYLLRFAVASFNGVAQAFSGGSLNIIKKRRNAVGGCACHGGVNYKLAAAPRHREKSGAIALKDAFRALVKTLGGLEGAATCTRVRKLNAITLDDAKFDNKNEDFMVPELGFAAFPDQAGILGIISFAE